MSTIFITCYHGFISRNIFNTDVLRILRNEPNLRIVIFCPTTRVKFLRKYYGGANVLVEGFDLEPIIREPRNKFWWRLGFLLQNTRYVRDQRLDHLYRNRNPWGYLNYCWVNGWAAILSKLPFIPSFYRFLDFRFSPKNLFSEFYKKYKPNLLFSTDIFSEVDALFLREGKARSIPLIGMVRSWDNTTTKGILRVMPDKIIVNGPLTKEELIRIHGVRAENVFIAGLPQFDSWLQGPQMGREEFFKKIGADPNKRLILFAPAGAILSDTDWQICQILKYAVKNGNLPPNIQFLVRNHPHHPADLSKFVSDPSFIIENPDVYAEVKSEKTGADLSPDDNAHLMHSVYYSDLVMYIATSLGLDATVFDKPQIIVSFDGWERKPYIRSVRRYHNEDNIHNLIVTGGARVVENPDELILWINKYLADPSIDESGRREIERRHMYKIDGQAGRRIAETILNFLNNQ